MNGSLKRFRSQLPGLQVAYHTDGQPLLCPWLDSFSGSFYRENSDLKADGAYEGLGIDIAKISSWT